MSAEPSRSSSTSASLIDRVRLADAAAWERLTVLYTPIIYGWARQARLQETDAADVAQEVFHAVAKGICRFGEDDKPTRFRAWLWGITRHKLQDHFRRMQKQPASEGGSDANLRLAQIPEVAPDSDSDAGLGAVELAHRALQLIKTDFQETTWQAFWRVTIEGQSAAEVAADLGLSVGSVYTAKSRVLAHLRRELDGLA